MINLKFEIKRILRGKKILIAIILSLLITSVLFVGNYMNQYKISNRIIEDYYPYYEKLINNTEFLIIRAEEKGVKDRERDEYLKSNQSLEIFLMELFQLADNEEFDKVPNKILEFYDKYEEFSKEVIIDPLAISDNKIASEREYYESLSKQNLPYEDNEYSITSANFLKSVVDKAYGLPLALLLLLLSIDIFTGENMNGTRKIRSIQPVRRINIFYSKVMVALIYSIIFIASILISSYLIGGIFGNGFGSFLYPVQRGPMLLTASKDSVVLFELMTIGKYILISTAYFLAYILFILSVVSFVTSLLKETLIVSAVSVILISLASLVSKNYIEVGQWIDGIKPKYPIINPFAFEFVEKMLQDLRLKPLLIILIPILFSLVLVYISYALTKFSFVQNFLARKKIKDGEISLKSYESKKTSKKFVNFRFELLKILKKREIYIVTIIIASLVLVYSYNSIQRYKEVYLDREDFYSWRLERTQETLNYYKDKEGPMEANLQRDYEKYLEFKIAYESNDRGKIADSMINEIRENGENAKGFMGYSDKGFASETIKINIDEMNEIKERKVNPPLPYAYEVRTTPFDKFRALQDKIRYIDNSKRYQTSITYIINGVFKDNLNYLILLIIAMAFAIGFTDEKEGKDTLRLLNIQPVESKRIYLGKFFARGLVFISLIVLVIVITFTSLFISGRKVEANYPAIYYKNKVEDDFQGEKFLRKNLASNEDNIPVKDERNNIFIYYSFRNMWSENIEMLVNFLLVGIMLIGLSMLISLNIKNRWQTSLLTLIIFVTGYGASTGLIKRYSYLFPFIWANQGLVSSGQGNIEFNTNLINSKLGIIALILWTFIISFVGIKRYNKRLGRD